MLTEKNSVCQFLCAAANCVFTGPCRGGTGGGCDKHCEATDNFVVTCSCDEGEVLGLDGKTCNNLRCDAGFVRVGAECVRKFPLHQM